MMVPVEDEASLRRRLKREVERMKRREEEINQKAEESKKEFKEHQMRRIEEEWTVAKVFAYMIIVMLIPFFMALAGIVLFIGFGDLRGIFLTLPVWGLFLTLQLQKWWERRR